MPEYPEITGQEYVISKGKGSGLQPDAYGKLMVGF